MSEEHNVSMPGMPAGATVIVSGVNDNVAPAAAPSSYRVGPADLTGSKLEAARYAESVAAQVAKGASNPIMLKRYSEAMQYSVGNGARPDWLPVDAAAADAPAPDTPAQALERQSPDSGDHGFNEAMHQAMDPMRPEELAHYRNDSVNKGIHPSVAETMAHLAGEYGIPRAVANDLQTVATTHFKGHESIPVLDDAGQAEMQAAAIDKYGEDVIRDLTQQARQVLADKGLLEHFDNLGLTKSTLAFDRRALRALIHWGKTGAA